MATLREDVKKLVASIALSQDTSLNWSSANPVVPSGVLCLETDTGKIKLGNGSTAWNDLGYKVDAVLTAAQKTLLDNAGSANGVATLDSAGTLPLAQIPVLTEDKLPLSLRGGIVRFVADIAAMEALTEKDGLIYVLDASADESVAEGSAQFVWNEDQSKWIKIGEAESLDLDLTNYFNYATMDSDDITEGDTHLFMTTAERAAVAQATADITTLSGTVTANKQAADATQTELTNYKTSNDAAVAANKAAADKTQEDLDTLEADVAAYKTANDAAVQAAAAAAATAQGEVDALEQTHATDKAALEQSIQDLADQLDDLTGGTSTDLTDIKARLDALDKTDGRVATLEGRVTANEAAITALQGEDTAIKQAATELAGRVTTAEGKITTAEGKITTLEGEMDAVEGRLDTAEGKITTVEGKVSTLEGEMDAAEGRLDALETTAADAVLYSHEDDLIIGGMNAATMKALYTA